MADVEPMSDAELAEARKGAGGNIVLAKCIARLDARQAAVDDLYGVLGGELLPILDRAAADDNTAWRELDYLSRHGDCPLLCLAYSNARAAVDDAGPLTANTETQEQEQPHD